MKRRTIACALLALTALFAGCGAPERDGGMSGDSMSPQDPGLSGSAAESFFESGGPNYQYESVVEQGFVDAAETPSSYFSLDRNTANYSQIRAQINAEAGRTIDPQSVRIEEMINYFSYDFSAPAEGEEMCASAFLTDCPWNEENRLVTVGIRTEERMLSSERNNYVFLIDVSGSMYGKSLSLVKYGIGKLTEGLGERDAVSVVTYANGVELRLEPTLCDEDGKKEILSAVNRLEANGSTNGAGGLDLAYRCAEKYKAEDGNNRVILMTDGDFNVGVSDPEILKETIRAKAQSGVYLTVLGVGMGNMRDDLMQSLALNGNGNYAYIDCELEAEKVLEEELNGTLVTVAKDVKAGVTFDGEKVARYRLIGYDAKRITEEDFDDSEKDAGEIGSNLTVVAVYEVTLAESAKEGDRIAEVVLRYKAAESGEEKEIREDVLCSAVEKDELGFIACVAEFGLLLRNSEYKGNADPNAVLSRLADLKPYLARDVYKTEFAELVAKWVAQKK